MISDEKSQFSHTRVGLFCATAEGVHIEVGYRRKGSETRMMGYRAEKEDVFIRVDTIHERDTYINLIGVVYAVRRPCSDFMDMLRRLTNYRMIMIIIIRRTDRQTDIGRQQRPRLRTASRGNNITITKDAFHDLDNCRAYINKLLL